MSVEALSWAWTQDITPPTRKLVLIAIADAASEDGVCWPSHKRLSEKTGASISSVRAHVRALVEGGLLEKNWRTRSNGSQTSNDYRLCLGGVSPEPPSSPLTGGGVSPLTPQNRKEEPSIAPSSPPDPVQTIFDHWRTVMDHPDARLDAVRRRMIERALKHSTPADCCRAINGCANSDFHMARGDNKSGTRYDAISLILRNREKVEWFMSMALPQSGVSEEEKRAIIAVRAGRALSASGEMTERAGDARELLLRLGWTITDHASGGVAFTPPAKTGGEGLTPPS